MIIHDERSTSDAHASFLLALAEHKSLPTLSAGLVIPSFICVRIDIESMPPQPSEKVYEI